MAHAVALVSYQQGQSGERLLGAEILSRAMAPGGAWWGPCSPGSGWWCWRTWSPPGGSALEAIQACREFGLTVARVIVLVDRQEGGREAVEAEVPGVQAVFTLAELEGRGA